MSPTRSRRGDKLDMNYLILTDKAGGTALGWCINLNRLYLVVLVQLERAIKPHDEEGTLLRPKADHGGLAAEAKSYDVHVLGDNVRYPAANGVPGDLLISQFVARTLPKLSPGQLAQSEHLVREGYLLLVSTLADAVVTVEVSKRELRWSLV
jgi:hypothetical protein